VDVQNGSKIKLIAATLLALAAAPALSQPSGLSRSFSDGYNFIKAVKDRDGDTATSLIQEPGSVVVNSKEQSTGNGALHILARDRDLTWLGFMLGKGAKPDLQNKEGMTALAIAAQIGWVEGAERLLRSRASVDLASNRGETPLMLAVQNRDVAMVRLLIGKGADPKRTDSVAGYSALDYARQDARSSAILKMLEEGPANKPKAVAGPGL
jgi:ankyrin repeat protein